MVDIPHFAEHPVNVSRVDGNPHKEGYREVVEAGRDKGAQESQLCKVKPV